jgi:hypothetical protein
MDLLNGVSKGDIVEYLRSDGTRRIGKITGIVVLPHNAVQIWATFQNSDCFNYDKKSLSSYIAVYDRSSLEQQRVRITSQFVPYDPTQAGDKEDDI